MNPCISLKEDHRRFASFLSMARISSSPTMTKEDPTYPTYMVQLAGSEIAFCLLCGVNYIDQFKSNHLVGKDLPKNVEVHIAGVRDGKIVYPTYVLKSKETRVVYVRPFPDFQHFEFCGYTIHKVARRFYKRGQVPASILSPVRELIETNI